MRKWERLDLTGFLGIPEERNDGHQEMDLFFVKTLKALELL